MGGVGNIRTSPLWDFISCQQEETRIRRKMQTRDTINEAAHMSRVLVYP